MIVGHDVLGGRRQMEGEGHWEKIARMPCKARGRPLMIQWDRDEDEVMCRASKDAICSDLGSFREAKDGQNEE